jgi:hypothetical protein
MWAGGKNNQQIDSLWTSWGGGGTEEKNGEM